MTDTQHIASMVDAAIQGNTDEARRQVELAVAARIIDALKTVTPAVEGEAKQD